MCRLKYIFFKENSLNELLITNISKLDNTKETLKIFNNLQNMLFFKQKFFLFMIKKIIPEISLFVENKNIEYNHYFSQKSNNPSLKKLFDLIFSEITILIIDLVFFFRDAFFLQNFKRIFLSSYGGGGNSLYERRLSLPR